ncbi:hypothetical protein HPB48_007034 [Haemaphysalis longicornis]|uniref:Uncharacterized protein n=1 Tax=Haemaphysalis longicornis TaxID=44386 RepID=A0A9J6FEZ2_HAELO|nr:hypothetical protein HPB48_007034 [Haemaphysalis longicornis]
MTGAKECTNKFKIPYVVKKRQWARKLSDGQQLRQQQLREFSELDATSFPPLRQQSTGKNSRSRSTTRNNSKKRDGSQSTRSASWQPSQTRERVAWADTLETPPNTMAPKSSDESAVLKALRAENEQLKQRIANLEMTNRSINEKLDRLLTRQTREQQAPPAPGPVPEQARTTETEPTSKRRAVDSAPSNATMSTQDRKLRLRQDKLEERQAKMEDRLDEFMKTTNERNLQVQSLLVQIQTQLATITERLNTNAQAAEQHIAPGPPPMSVIQQPQPLPIPYQSWPPQ